MPRLKQGIEDGYLQTDLNANAKQIKNLASPTDSTDAATKNYVDTNSGGGGGGGVNSITLTFQNLFGNPTNFTADNNANWTGNALLVKQAPKTIFANPTTADDLPVFISQSAARTLLAINNVDNTSDANKPLSTAATTANTALQAGITTNANNISTLSSTVATKVSGTDLTAALDAFTGTANIATVGTITTGTWNGNVLANTYLPTLSNILTPTGNLNMGSFKITSLAVPTNATDAANKNYVDSVSSGGPPHPAVAVATTANLTLSGEQTIDGVLTSASRILVKNQSAATGNGIYVTAAGAWSRATDADTGAEISGIVFVTGGTLNAGTTWGATTPQPITLGSTDIAYTLTGQGTTYSAGTGLDLTGTVFSVENMAANSIKGNNTGGSDVPLDLTVGQTKTLLALNNVENTALSTWAGSANITTIGTIATGTVPVSKLSGNTTIGTNMLTLTNPSAVTFPRFNADNTVTARSAANFKSDIGATGTVTSVDVGADPNGNNATDLITVGFGANTTTTPKLSIDKAVAPPTSFYGNSTLGFLAPTFMNAATARSIMGAEAALTFNAPLARSVNIVSVTKADATHDGYLALADFNYFNAGVGHAIRTASQTSGTFTIPTQTPPITRVLIDNSVTTPNLVIVLPLASNYNLNNGFPFLEIVDISNAGAGLNFGIKLRHAGGDLIDGTILDKDLPRAMAYIRLNSNGSDQWTSTKYFTTALSNPSVPAGIATFNTATLSAARTVTVPNANSTLMVASNTSELGVVKDILIDGTVDKVQLGPVDLVPNPYRAGSVNSPLASPITVTSVPPTIYDSIAIEGTLTGPVVLNFPAANAYQRGQDVELVDFSGTVNRTRFISIFPASGDSFNLAPGGAGIQFDETNGKKLFTSDGVSNWSVPTSKATVTSPWLPAIQPASGVYTLIVDSTISGAQKGHMTLGNGANVLQIAPSPFDGMEIELVLVQPTGGAPGTLGLPSPSYVQGNGLGLVTLTTTSPAVGTIDRLNGSYDGALPGYIWETPMVNYTSAALPAAPSALSSPSGTSNSIDLQWTDNANNETGFDIQRKQGAGSFASVATAGANLSGGTTTYTDSGLAASTAYSYKIAAVNSAGSSAFTSTVSRTTSSACSTVTPDTIGTWLATGNYIQIALGASQQVMAGNNYVPSATNTSPCRITAPIFKFNSPTGILTMYIYDSDGASGIPGTLLYTSTNTITPDALPLTEADALLTPLQFSFTGVTLTAGHVYYIAVGSSTIAVSASTNHFRWVSQANQVIPTWLVYKSPAVITWTALTTAPNSGYKTFIKTYK